MVSPRLTKRRTAALFLCVFVAIPMIRVKGQEKLQVAPPAKSDSYAEDENGRKTRIQHREVPATNFQIAGVDLAFKGDFFPHTFRLLGRFTTVGSGDASTGLEEACYRSAEESDNTYLIFGEGEVDRSFTLSSDASAWKWKTPCKSSSKISRSLATSSGLHLGQTQEQVIAILGLPTRRSKNVKSGRDDLVYNLEAKKKMAPEELALLLKDELKRHPDLDQPAYIKNYGFDSFEVYIRATFVGDALTRLEVSWSEQD
jgi:hypothetical protein